MRLTGLFVMLALAIGCAQPPPTLSPKGVAAFQATRVVKALDILRDTAIDANAQTPPLISVDDTRKVVQYHRSALLTIETVPQGWAPVVTSGLTELEKNLAPEHRTRLAPYFILVRTLIQEITNANTRNDGRSHERRDFAVAYDHRVHPCWCRV